MSSMWPSGVALAVYGAVWCSGKVTSWYLAGLTLVTYLAAGGHYTLWQVYATLPRDMRGLLRYLKLLYKIRYAQRNNLSVPAMFHRVVQQHPNKVAFFFEDQTWTFRQVEQYSNKVGNFFAERGIQHGDSVALFMENRVEYVCIWLGLTKVGAVPALINYNLRHEPLKHCIKVANCKAVICGAELQNDLIDIHGDGLEDILTYVAGADQEPLKISDATNLDAELKSAKNTVPIQLKDVGFADNMVYIYTSGTTGLPKAAIIKHSRAMFAACGMGIVVGLDSRDVVYDPLPLYHTAGGIIGVGQSLLLGAGVVLRKKFSATQYLSECRRFGCTAGQYIGEICRYLYNMPEKPEDTNHKLRIMFGNGLRPSLWVDFQKRFKIPQIGEFYGSTEGNANIINIDGKPGAVGFVSVLFPSVYPVALLKVNPETNQIVRGPDGLCIRCKPGEPGEFIGKIVRNDPVRDFHGYADKKASDKKIVKDVFAKGDMAFLSGDILVMDEEGYLYFKDRTGDTFRWKGENVSTCEVEAVISKIAGHADVVVYGVEVPGAEGRAGMATVLDENNSLDLKALYSGLESTLASYARPLIIRCAATIERTGTFKLKKIHLQKEGFNPEVCSDSLYFIDAKEKAYVPLTPELYKKIISGQVRM